MADNADRRLPIRETSSVLRRQLNAAQLATFNTLERFGWELKFIRRELDQKLVVLFDPDGRKYAVLDDDGDLNENPVFEKFR
jgi:hypothetical protein